MKFVWIAALSGLMLAASPAKADDNPVKTGVEAYARGDYKMAVALWRGPAERGDADAQFNLGQAYKLGRGVPLDSRLAEQWFRRAAEQGHEQAGVNYGLALFENGKRADAVPWLERGVARGDARAQYILGVMLFNGDVVAKNPVRAYALVVRSSQSGLDAASKALAQMDQYLPVADRQRGLALARELETHPAIVEVPVTIGDASGTAAVSAEAAAPSTPIPRPASPRPEATTPSVAVAAPPAPAAASPRAATPAPRPAPSVVPQARPLPARTTTPSAPPRREGAWQVQLGAFGDPANAHRLWAQVAGRFPGRQPHFVKTGTLTRLLIGPYASRTDAQAGCRGVSPCVPVAR